MHAALQQFDWWGVQELHALATSNALTAFIFFFFAEMLIFGFAFLLWYLWRRPVPVAKHHGNQKAVVLALMSVVMALACKAIIALVVTRPRPFVTHADIIPFPLHVDAASFPSGHSLVAMAIAASIWFSGNKRLGGWLMVFACLIGIARIGAAVHYPTDISGGLGIGFLAAYFLHHEASSIKSYLPDHA